MAEYRYAAQAALRDVAHRPFWLDSPHAPIERPTLGRTPDGRLDLVVVGAGFTGLWTALRALERSPGSKVAVLESGRLASAASGRNGGFVEASITHGLENGLRHFPDEIDHLERLGAANLEGIAATIAASSIACGFERGGALSVATAPWHRAGLAAAAELALAHGVGVELFERSALRALVDSPTYLGGLRYGDNSALVDPARLAWGLADAVERAGGTIYEHSEVYAIEALPGGVRLRTAEAEIDASHVILATSAFPPLVKQIRRYVLPVYDYVLVTEPLPDSVLADIGWRGREGVSDRGNRFHYYRLTEDNRILFGGYDAIYNYNNGIGARFETRPASFDVLASHFFTTFPQCEGMSFTHAWGGAIDTCSRFCAFFDTAFGGRAAYAAGFTGLGVGASRFAADVLLDLLSGTPTERTELKMVQKKPFPFPPEPLRSLVVAATTRSLRDADANEGRRNSWLRVLDAMGVGFDS